MIFSHPQHGFDKIASVFSKHPGDPDNEIFLQKFGNGQLTGQLGLAVNIQRLVVLAVRIPGRGALTVKNIVGAEINHLAVQFAAYTGDISGAVHIDFLYQFLFVFLLCGVHGGPGGTVHHHIGTAAADGLGHNRWIRDIRLHIGHGADGRSVLNAAVGFFDI